MNNLTKAVKAALKTGSPATSVGGIYKSWTEAVFLSNFLFEIDSADLSSEEWIKLNKIVRMRALAAVDKLQSMIEWAKEREREERANEH